MIKVDEKGKQLIQQAQDAILRGHGSSGIFLFNELEKDLILVKEEEKTEILDGERNSN